MKEINSLKALKELSINFASLNHSHGLLHDNYTVTVENTTTDNGWSMISNTYNGFLLKSVRSSSTAPPWLQDNYSAGIAFGGADTKGILSMAYRTPSIRFAGGNGTTPVWYLTLTGTSGKSYNMDSLIANTANTLTTERTINGTSFNGSANITTETWGASRNVFISDSDSTNTGLATLVNGSTNPTLKLPATIKASLNGNASTATTLQTTRTINGTNFDGSANITTSNWGTSRTITIGSTGKLVNGSTNVSWSLSEIGAAAINYVKLENRTTDPTSPENGYMWLRTDL